MGLTVGTIEEKHEYCRTLIYGGPGAGKTSFAASAPNPIWMDYENSTEVLRIKYPHVKLAGTYAELSNWDNVLDFVRKIDKTDAETLVIDTVSSQYQAYMNFWKSHGSKGPDRHIATEPDFRKITNVFREIFGELINAPVHVIIVAHEKVLRDPDTNRVLEARPGIPPAAQASLEQLVNEAFYLERKPSLAGKGTPERRIHVDSDGKIFAKNRRNLTESIIENPTWEKIYNGTQS